MATMPDIRAPDAHTTLTTPPGAHVVGFYDSDEQLVAAVAPYLCRGLEGGAAVVVVATPRHRADLAAAVATHGTRLGAALRDGRYASFDADDEIARFVRDGLVDPGSFARRFGGAVRDAAGPGRRVLVFGEMVARLWARGDVVGAIEVERRWNDLAHEHDFTLVCAYPVAAMQDGGGLRAAKAMCDVHAHVIDLPAPERHARDAGRRFFPPSVASVGEARTFVADAVGGLGEVALIDVAQLVVSELGTNAVMHARSPFEVVVRRAADGVLLEVRDGVPDRLPVLRPEPTVEGGRGIALVEAFAAAWSVEVDARGKVVRARLAG
jgi:anti-sigma regulatory factor (Ser/Thr protein kinase)